MLKLKNDAKESLIKGVNTVADAVKVTMGAEGKTVIIRNKMGFSPNVTKDGVTVAENVELEDEFEELGAKAVKDGARKTVDLLGDGTTTFTVTTQELVNLGFAKLDEGVSHVELREGMTIAMKDVSTAIASLKKKVGQKEMKHIASVSANNDEKLGALIADVYKRIGVDGAVDVQEGVTKETKVTYVEGLSLDRGWALPMFINEDSTQTVELEDVSILIFDGKINTVADISETVRKVQTEGKSLLILCEDIDEGVMTMLVKSKLQGTLRVSVTLNPDFGTNRTSILEDLAIFSGAEVFTPKISNKITLGYAKKIISDRTRTVVMVEDTKTPQIIDRIESLKTQIETSNDKMDLNKLKRRLTNLQNTVAVITVGGITEMEVREKKDRIDDAVSALRSALQSGYVAGGGSTLLFISKYKMRRKLKGGQKEGYDMFKAAIQKPFEQILANAGLAKENYAPKLRKYGQGVNVKTRKIENLLQKGIIDSAKVTEISVENAYSIASLILQTDCLIVNGGL